MKTFIAKNVFVDFFEKVGDRSRKILLSFLLHVYMKSKLLSKPGIPQSSCYTITLNWQKSIWKKTDENQVLK